MCWYLCDGHLDGDDDHDVGDKIDDLGDAHGGNYDIDYNVEDICEYHSLDDAGGVDGGVAVLGDYHDDDTHAYDGVAGFGDDHVDGGDGVDAGDFW